MARQGAPPRLRRERRRSLRATSDDDNVELLGLVSHGISFNLVVVDPGGILMFSVLRQFVSVLGYE